LAAAAVLPKSSARVWPFVRGIVAEDAGEILSGIEHTADDQVWLVPTGVADSFREALQAQIAHKHYENTFVTDGPTCLCDAITAILAERIDGARGPGYLLDDTEEINIICRWLLELTETLDHPARLAAAFRVAVELAAAYQYSQAVEVMVPVLGSAPSKHPDVLTIRSTVAWWMGEMGRPEDAIAMYRQLLIDQQNVLAPNHAKSHTRGNFGTRLADSGRLDEAVDPVRISPIRTTNAGRVFRDSNGRPPDGVTNSLGGRQPGDRPPVYEVAAEPSRRSRL
jgi:hypothetical protein